MTGRRSEKISERGGAGGAGTVPRPRRKDRSRTVPAAPEKPALPGAPGAGKGGTGTVAVPGAETEAEAAAAPAGRAFWSGAITIGLVNVPVQLHTMVRDNSFRFRLLHKEDGQPLRYDRVCTRDNTVVPWSATVRGYEVRRDEFLVFTPEELKAVAPESDRKIRLTKFVYYLSLDPMYFGTSYLLVPDRSEDAYSLLLTAIRDTSRAGVGTITMRTKEHPVVVHAYGGGLVATTLHYPDEVTQPAAYAPLRDLPRPKEAELALAKRIVDELAGDFAITEFHDRYREAVLALIEKKLAGEKVVVAEPHPEEAKELMEALRETLAKLDRP